MELLRTVWCAHLSPKEPGSSVGKWKQIHLRLWGDNTPLRWCLELIGKCEHVINILACILRSFQHIEFNSALIEVHLIEPFLALTYHSSHNMIPWFQRPNSFTRPAFWIISSRRFETCLWIKEIFNSVNSILPCYVGKDSSIACRKCS